MKKNVKVYIKLKSNNRSALDVFVTPGLRCACTAQPTARQLEMFPVEVETCRGLLTPWSRVLLDKVTVNFVASQEIPRIYGTRKFLTVPTRARH
jgi:hypothetical protein